MRATISLFVILIFHLSINAFTLDDKLSDKSMEKRATNLFEIIKCPICSGESLSESQSQLAYDMRKIIRKKIMDGATNKEIISELKSSYGDSIIITPPVKSSTYILWCVPLITLLIGCFLIWKYIANQNKVSSRQCRIATQKNEKEAIKQGKKTRKSEACKPESGG